MVYLPIAVILACCAIALAYRAKPDPHHTFIFSLLPMLDLERSAGSRLDWAEILQQPTRTPAKAPRRQFGKQLERVPEERRHVEN